MLVKMKATRLNEKESNLAQIKWKDSLHSIKRKVLSQMKWVD